MASKDDSSIFLSNKSFRNAKFTGLVSRKTNQSSSILGKRVGIMLDDMFLFCLSNWSERQFHGPTILIYPYRQIFYGFFESDGSQAKNTQKVQEVMKKLKGIWCFIINSSNQYSIKLYGAGGILKNSGNSQYLAISQYNTITKIKVITTDMGGLQFEIEEQYDLSQQENQEEKRWEIIQDILSYRVALQEQSLRKFINHHFIANDKTKEKNSQRNKEGRLIEIPVSNKHHASTYLYKFESLHEQNSQGPIQEQSLGVTLQYESIKQYESCVRVMNVGNFHSAHKRDGNKFLEYGRKFIYHSSPVTLYRDSIEQIPVSVSEGLFGTDQQYEYVNSSNKGRPNECLKTAHRYFKRSTNFSNTYMYMNQADSLYGVLTYIVKDYVEQCNQRNGQLVLEKGKRENNNQNLTQPRPINPRKQKENFQQAHDFKNNFNSRQSKYGKYEYDLDQAKQIILKNIANKKRHIPGTTNNLQRSRSRSRSRSLQEINKSYYHKIQKTLIERPRKKSPVKTYQNKNYYGNTSPSKKYQYFDENNTANSHQNYKYRNKYRGGSDSIQHTDILSNYPKNYENKTVRIHQFSPGTKRDTYKLNKDSDYENNDVIGAGNNYEFDYRQNNLKHKNHEKIPQQKFDPTKFDTFYQPSNQVKRLYTRNRAGFRYTQDENIRDVAVSKSPIISKSMRKKTGKRNYTYFD